MKRIEELHFQYPEYGYRKVWAEIRREGHIVNIKRIERLWKILGYLSILPRKNLSKSSSSHQKFPYLLNGMWIEKPNQVFSTDITFLPLKNGFVYLVMVIDWYSRYILSWEISNSMSVHFCIEALEKALRISIPDFFNTDQGSQFTSNEFVDILLNHSIKVSMDGVGRAIDNVYMERGWWSLKYEMFYVNAPETAQEMYKLVSDYVDHFNMKRPHQALLYAVPHEIYHGITPKYSKGKYNGFRVKCAKI